MDTVIYTGGGNDENNAQILLTRSFSDTFLFYKAFFSHFLAVQLLNAVILSAQLNSRVYITDTLGQSASAERRWYLGFEYSRLLVKITDQRAEIVYYHIPLDLRYTAVPSSQYTQIAANHSVPLFTDQRGTYVEDVKIRMAHAGVDGANASLDRLSHPYAHPQFN